MIAVWPSRAGFGEQMAEAVLATALAVPVIFAFAQLRDGPLVAPATAPQLAETQATSRDTSTTERPSPTVRVVLSGGSLGEMSVWDARLAVLMEAIRLAGHHTSESTVESEAGRGASDPREAGASLEPPTEGVSTTAGAGRPTGPARGKPVRMAQH
jgi:hypothetical protein